ncbi:MAG: cobalamin-dependent protein, partial [Spirochaetales bacterium]|nr:cobalamin-dependent protein [Spirochaetales bacterium]
LEALKHVRMDMGLHATLGVSNISFGLPERANITKAFLTMALHSGLDFPIINPNSAEIMDAVHSYMAVAGLDKDCEKYIARFAQTATAANTTQTKPKAQTMTLEDAILKGLGQETENITKTLLETMDAMDVINSRLIPALDVVGDKYEKQEIFLPQLINAANAAGRGFELIKSRIRRNGEAGVSKGKIIIATVEGDIHDIGKNIVKVVLENYGYNVIDLGKDVPVQTVVKRTIEEDAHLVALSALMPTTVESMRRTIAALRQSGHPCKIMVGGAVLTAEYAKQIGADFYTKDPKESADTARRVLGK